MHVPALFALCAWIPVGVILFRRFPVRMAILGNLLGGWAILPSANFAPSPAEFPYWIMGVCLPTEYFITKATVIAIAVLLGSLAFDFKTVKNFRPSWCDLPMALWCIVPLLSALANRTALYVGFRSVFYLMLAWGVPYLAGRIYFVDRSGLLLAAKAFVYAGLLYIPLCLIEFVTGPQFYAHVYGYQPYRWIGAERFAGFRPIGFLEDGNQLGVWMACSALVAVTLTARKYRGSFLRIPEKWCAALLVIVTLLCQSWGSILLLACMIPFVLMGRRTLLRRMVTAVVLAMILLTGVRLLNIVSLKALVQRNALAHAVANDLKHIGRGSFGWRLEQDELHVKTAIQKPIFGDGRWNWWQRPGSELRPWSLWLLSFGMFGSVGLIALGCILLLPVVNGVWDLAAKTVPGYFELRLMFAGLILLVTLDSLLNGAMILPVLLLTGGLMNRYSARGA